jgi:hypothetical protein
MTDRCAECGGIVYTDPGDSYTIVGNGFIHDECADIIVRRPRDFLFAGTLEFTKMLNHQSTKGNENE